MNFNFDNVFLSAFDMSSSGPDGDWRGCFLGRFEPIIGEERDGCPVYKQATSREMLENRKRATSRLMLENTETLLYRWGN